MSDTGRRLRGAHRDRPDLLPGDGPALRRALQRSGALQPFALTTGGDAMSPLLLLNGLVPAADRLPYFDTAISAALAVFTALGRTILAAVNASDARDAIGAAPTASPTFTGTATFTGNAPVSNVAHTPGTNQLTRAVEVEAAITALAAAIATQLNGKANTGAIGSSGLTMTSARMLLRTTAGTGAVEEATAAQGRTFLELAGLALLNTVAAAQIDSNAVTTAKIADGNVTLAKCANIAGHSLLGNNTASEATPAALAASDPDEREPDDSSTFWFFDSSDRLSRCSGAALKTYILA